MTSLLWQRFCCVFANNVAVYVSSVLSWWYTARIQRGSGFPGHQFAPGSCLRLRDAAQGLSGHPDSPDYREGKETAYVCGSNNEYHRWQVKWRALDRLGYGELSSVAPSAPRPPLFLQAAGSEFLLRMGFCAVSSSVPKRRGSTSCGICARTARSLASTRRWSDMHGDCERVFSHSRGLLRVRRLRRRRWPGAPALLCECHPLRTRALRLCAFDRFQPLRSPLYRLQRLWFRCIRALASPGPFAGPGQSRGAPPQGCGRSWHRAPHAHAPLARPGAPGDATGRPRGRLPGLRPRRQHQPRPADCAAVRDPSN